ncbi:MAG TPA: FAD-dependent oxidoreductase [Syntrophorhabdaceae bacterium]|nr:FAD-dependent oxidoreductase [Syntrophorhabdaceae bacterium]
MTNSLALIADEVVETDFLIVGGGLAGCMAAIEAKKKSNIDVVIMEKSSIEYGGTGVGLDGFHVEFPGIIEHPVPKDVDEAIAAKSLFGANRYKGLVSSKSAITELKNWIKPLAILEDIGVQIREDDGKMWGAQNYRGGTVHSRLKKDENGKPFEPNVVMYRGSDLKWKLAKAVYEAGVRVFNRTMITSIITKNGTAVGATALNSRTGKFVVFKSKAVLIATGRATRLNPYPWAPYPNNLFYSIGFPGNCGGGIIGAFRAGAKVANMECLWVYAVSKGINASGGAGGAGWHFRLLNSKGESLEDKYPELNIRIAGGNIPPVNFMYAPGMKEPTTEKDIIVSKTDSATDDDISATYYTAATEPPRTLKFLKMAGGLKDKRPAEGVPYPAAITISGIRRINEHAESTIGNLFAAGDCACHTAGSRALVWGYIVGSHVAEQIGSIQGQSLNGEQLRQVEQAKARVLAPLGRVTRNAVNPLELEDYVRTEIIKNYVGIKKIKARMERAKELLKRVKEEAVPLLVADGPHELMRAVEAQDIIDIAELYIDSSLLRTESRVAPMHYREDYPDQDSNWDKITITARKNEDSIEYLRESVE